MDDLPFSQPFLLSGKISQQFLELGGMPKGGCTEQWLCDNPRILEKLVKQLAVAGVTYITVPTFGANSVALGDYSLKNSVLTINQRLVSVVRNAAFSDTIIGGGLAPAVSMCDDEEALSMDELVAVYREQIKALADAGVEYLYFASMTSLVQMRAGVMAAKEFSLPVMVSVLAEENGKTPDGAGFLPCLLTLQNQDITAFGIDGFSWSQDMLSLFKNSAPYSQVPFIAVAENPCEQENIDFTKLCMDYGVSVFGVQKSENIDYFIDLSNLIKNNEIKPIKKDLCRIAANEAEAFFLLDDENLFLSAPVDCSFDIADELIDLEDESINVAKVEINSMEEALLLSQNAHMSRLPIAIVTDSIEVLKRTLYLYNGIALVCSDCEIEYEELCKVAKQYGAIVI